MSHEKELGTAIKARVSPNVVADAINTADSVHACEIAELISMSHLTHDEQWKGAYLAALDRNHLFRLVSTWPFDAPLSLVANLCKHICYVDEALGCELIEALAPSIAERLQNDPQGAFHELNDVFWHDTKLLFQTDETSHLSVLADMFVEAKRFDCLIAFAKTTGFNLLQVKIEECLKNGGEGRLVIGLSLHQTEPKLLSQLYKFTNKYNLELFLSNSEKTFHPKVYAFEKGKGGCTVVMGSANLTAGGLVNNIEASSITSDRSGKLFAKVSNYIGWLIDQKVVKKASPELIQKYAEEYDKLKWKFYDYQHGDDTQQGNKAKRHIKQ